MVSEMILDLQGTAERTDTKPSLILLASVSYRGLC